MTAAHDAVVVARLLTSALGGAIPCVYYDKPIPDSLTRYLRVRTGTGLVTAERTTGPLLTRRKTYWLTGVGSSPAQAAWVLEQATTVLLNWIPPVTGWTTRRLILSASQPVDADPDVDNRFFGVDQWDLISTPVPA